MVKKHSKPKNGSERTICVVENISDTAWMSCAVACRAGRWRGKEWLLRAVSAVEVWEVFVPLLRAASRAVGSRAEPGTPAEQ